MGMMITVLLLAGLGWMIYSAGRKNSRYYVVPPNTSELLEEHIAFYRGLGAEDKDRFEARVKQFLGKVAVRGVKTEVNDIDRILVAAGAIIPIFAFDNWEYRNINEVLLYPGAFTREFSLTGAARSILGMIGDGAMNRAMILSQPSLRASFHNREDGHNVAIHEFVHLIDKADGAVDGIPEYLLDKEYLRPWLSMIRETIKEMHDRSGSDIDMYGTTNEAEFLSVVSEYFFEHPDQLKTNHPELFSMLVRIFGTR